MKITVERFTSDDESTISLILVDGIFFCFGLEDQFQEKKVENETRIPAGCYKIGIRDVGGFHKRYSERFKTFHQGMLEVKDVPNFEYILIHVGNDEGDTAGCLLTGVIAYSKKNSMALGRSVKAYEKLYQHVIESAKKKNLSIEYIDKDNGLPPEPVGPALPLASLPLVTTEDELNILRNDQMPIMQPLPMQEDDSHRHWVLTEDWYLDCKPLKIVFFIPKGFIFNGASVPRVFSNIFPATGYLFLAALIHDYLYGHASYKYKYLCHAMPQVKSINKADSDQIFKDIANWLYKSHWFKTRVATAALKIGGQGAWDTCRKADGTYVKSEPYKYYGNINSFN